MLISRALTKLCTRLLEGKDVNKQGTEVHTWQGSKRGNKAWTGGEEVGSWLGGFLGADQEGLSITG
jgi:hypothetical protein